MYFMEVGSIRYYVDDGKNIVFCLRSIKTDLGSLIGNTQMRKFQDFLETQILREINFGQFEAPKTSILTILAFLTFDFLENFFPGW